MPGEATVPPGPFDKPDPDWGLAGLGPLTIALPPGLPATSIEIAISRDGERWTLVDGEPALPNLESSLEDAIRELELRGREHFEAFVARAEAAGSGSWELTVDPL